MKCCSLSRRRNAGSRSEVRRHVRQRPVPVLALETARRLGHEVVAVGIQEEASREIEPLAARTYWVSLGELSKLIDILKREGIQEVLFCGQVKHTKIFSAIRPDWRLAKLLFSLRDKNTDALIGGVAKVLSDEGIELGDSTRLLKPLLADEGVLTRRKPDNDEERDIHYGRRVAGALAAVDIGQSVAVAERACVAVEAMEGTDAMLERAAALANGKPLRLVKSSRRRQHLQFDVPVAGPGTIHTMQRTGTTALAVDAGRTLLLDKAEMLGLANAAGITIIGFRAGGIVAAPSRNRRPGRTRLCRVDVLPERGVYLVEGECCGLLLLVGFPRHGSLETVQLGQGSRRAQRRTIA